MLKKISVFLTRGELLEKCAFRLSLLFCFFFSAAFIARSGTTIAGRAYFTLFDDAMISMRYAQNLAAGNGLTWNIGGDKIEGFTNLFWTLWMAVLHFMPVHESKAALLVMLSCTAILLVNLFVLRDLLREHGASLFVKLLALPCVALYYPVYFWTLRGMEVGFLMLLLNASLLIGYRLIKQFTLSRLFFLSAMLCMGVLTRTDFVPPALVISAAAGLLCEKKYRITALFCLTGSILASFSAHSFFSYFYYGDFLPNTYYLKLTGVTLAERLSRGIEMFIPLVRQHLLALLLFAPCAIFLLKKKEGRNGLLSLVLAVLCAMQIGYSVYVGGDAWEWMRYANRYVTPIVPLLFIVITLGIDALVRAVPRMPKFMPVALAVCLCFFWTAKISGTHYRLWLNNNCHHMYDDLAWMELGVWLKNNTREDTTIGVFCAGNIPYFAHRTAIDFLGKMDRTIAKSEPRVALYTGQTRESRFYPGHNKWDYAYSIGKLQPDFIVQMWRLVTPGNIDEQIIGWGYRQVSEQMFIKNTSMPKINLATFNARPEKPKDLLEQLSDTLKK